MLTIAQIIDIGKICTYLSDNDVARGALYGKRLDPRLPLMLAIETDSLKWVYEATIGSTSSLITLANYLYDLCQPYAAQARVILALGGGGIVVNPTGAQTSIVGIDIQFRVGISGMNPGDTVYVLNYKSIIVDTVFVFLDGSDLPSGEATQISASIIYTSTEATITFNQSVFDGQLYKIKGLRFTA